MSACRFLPRAERDLEEIVDFVLDESGPNRAEAVRQAIFAGVDKLSEMPGMGHVRADLTQRPVLFWSVFSYLIVYRSDTVPLQVLRVLSGWRDVAAIL